MGYIDPFAWIIAILMLYVFVGSTGVALLLALRARKSSLIGAVLATVVTGAFILFSIGRSAPYGLLAGGVISSLLVMVARRFVLQPAMVWQDVKYGRAVARQMALHLTLMTGSVIFLVPFAWLVVTSLKEEKEMSAFPPVWIPTQQVRRMVDGEERGVAIATRNGAKVTVVVLKDFDSGVKQVRVLEPASLAGTEFTAAPEELTEVRHVAPVWKNYPDAIKFLPPETKGGLVFLRNTLTISAWTIVGTLLSSSMVAYSFSRLRWPGRDAMFLMLLATMMLPSAVTMMPVFLIFRSLGWVDTLRPLIVPSFFGAAFNIFMLRQFFLGIPTELEDAAKIDGCSHYMIFWRIMLPQIKPALAAVTIMAFMGAWNDFRGPLIYVSSPENQPLAYALQLFQTARAGEPGMLMAASTMVMLPVLLLFFFTQRYFIQGVTLTGIKG